MTVRWRRLMVRVVWNAAVPAMGMLLGLGVAQAQSGVDAVLPNGRQIRPEGRWLALAPYPFALAIRPDGGELAVPSIGFPFALNLVSAPASASPTLLQLRSKDKKDPSIEVHAGLAYSPDGSVLYVATGDSGRIVAYRTDKQDDSQQAWKQTAAIPLDGALQPVAAGKKEQRRTNSFAATLVVSTDGRTLFVLDQANWRVVVIDLASGHRIASIATGTYPFGLALSPAGDRLYVTNTGLFEYTPIPGADPKDALGTGLHFPPFGYPSQAARKGAMVEGRKVPGLGDENSTRGSSLWTYDVQDRAHPMIAAKLRLGERITESKHATVGGAAPTGVVAGSDAVYVALAHQDAVVKVSPDGSRVEGEMALSPFLRDKRFLDAWGHPLRGVMPSGLALRDGRLYVAESGINAVAVVDTASMHVVEHIPAGWNPSAVGVSPDGATLYVVNAKGRGTGPNGGKGYDPAQPTYIGSKELGSLQTVRLDALPGADALTQAVVAANTAAIAARPTLPRLKHCFLIIRENRTYDEILGDVSGANGDASLARYGMSGWAEEQKSATSLRVTPNLHALASQYAISDNFFVDGDVSADGHRWVVGINPTPFFNTAWTSAYGGRRSGQADAEQPGRRAPFGHADAPMPEDEPQFGSLWEHLVASGQSIFNYGEGLELEGSEEVAGSEPQGQRMVLNSPAPRPVFQATDRSYPTFNLGIPDQLRAAEFMRDFDRRFAGRKLPALIVIRLPNDHTAEPRAGDGYPYRASYVADNDLALGKIIAFLSSKPFWKDSAVFVTEDDAQGGVDHVDAHRSVLLMASSWVKPGAVSHQHTSMGSITRTIDELLGIGPLNLEDALASELDDVFDSTPHLTSFDLQPSDPRVFDPARARIARPKTKQAAAELRDMDDADEIRKQMDKSRGHLSKPD